MNTILLTNQEKFEKMVKATNPYGNYYLPKGLKNGSYTRVGDRDELMTDYEIYALQSYNDHIFEDTRPTKRAVIEDLNQEELEKYINKIKKDKPNFSKNTFENA